MPSSSPWGTVQTSVSHQRGLRTVSTARPGGILVSNRVVDQLLSEAARRRGFSRNGYLCFEEDCDAAIVLFEIPAARTAYRHATTHQPPTAANLRESLARWHGAYQGRTGTN